MSSGTTIKSNKVGVLLPESTIERHAVETSARNHDFVSRTEYETMVATFQEELEDVRSQLANSIEDVEARLIAKMEGTDSKINRSISARQTSVKLADAGALKTSLSSLGSLVEGHSNIRRSFTMPTQFRDKSKLEQVSHDEAFERMGGQREVDKMMELALRLSTRTAETELTQKIRDMFPSHQDPALAERFVTQHYVSNIHDLYRCAMEARPSFEDFVNDMASSTTALCALHAPPKGRSRAVMKAKYKYASEETGKISWYRLADVVRATLVYSDIPSMYEGCNSVINAIDAFPDAELKEINDRYLKPFKNGYRDLQVLVSFNGHVCELQFNVELMIHAKLTTGHSSFELVRTLQAAVKEGDALQCEKTLEWWLGGGEEREFDDRNIHVVKETLRSDSAKGLLVDAAAKGHDEIVSRLLSCGANGNVQDPSTGDTALHAAVAKGHDSVVWVLLDQGNVNVTIKNDQGFTALVNGFIMHWSNPTESMARALVMLSHACGLKAVTDAQAMVREELKRRLLPSHLLVDHAQEGNVQKLQELLRDFADPNSERDSGESAIVASIKARQIQTAKILLEYGAKASLLDRPSGQTRLAMLTRYIPASHQKEWLRLFRKTASLADFFQAGFRGHHLVRFFNASDDDLLEAGLSDGAVAATRFLLTRHTVEECKEIGCDPADCCNAGYNPEEVATFCKRLHDARGSEGVKVIAEGKCGEVTEVKATGRALKLSFEDGSTNSDLKEDGWAYLVVTPVCVYDWT